MNITEAQFRELQNNVSNGGKSSVNPSRPPAGGSRKPKPVTFYGPLDITLKLYGHCPSKKNGWSVGADGKMYIPEEMAEQIDVLTTQAMYGWSQALRSSAAPVAHPEVWVCFFVSAKRQDEDGMWTTILDCLQKAGVLVNDNIAHFNGWKHHAPCEFVSESEERVEIRLVKN